MFGLKKRETPAARIEFDADLQQEWDDRCCLVPAGPQFRGRSRPESLNRFSLEVHPAERPPPPPTPYKSKDLLEARAGFQFWPLVASGFQALARRRPGRARGEPYPFLFLSCGPLGIAWNQRLAGRIGFPADLAHRRATSDGGWGEGCNAVYGRLDAGPKIPSFFR